MTENMYSYILRSSFAALFICLFNADSNSNGHEQLFLIGSVAGNIVSVEKYEMDRDTVPDSPANINKNRRNKKDTSPIRVNLGDSSYVGSAGTRSGRTKSAQRGRRARKGTDTSIRANIGDSTYPGSGVRSRSNNDTIERKKRNP